MSEAKNTFASPEKKMRDHFDEMESLMASPNMDVGKTPETVRYNVPNDKSSDSPWPLGYMSPGTKSNAFDLSQVSPFKSTFDLDTGE